jgi:hypothetical protein
MKIKKLTEIEANEIIERGGGMTWILFPGDVFDPRMYEDWAGECPSDEQILDVDEKVDALEDGEALQIL